MKNVCSITFLRAREKHLPDETDFERMISAENLSKSFSVLQDTHYAPFLSDRKEEEFTSVFEDERRVFKKDLQKMGVSQDVINFLHLKADFHNLALFLKKDIFGEDFSEKDVSEEGISDFEKLKKKHSELIDEIKSKKFENFSELYQFLTEAYFKRAAELTEQEEIKKFLKDYYQVIKEKKEKGTLTLKETKKRLTSLEEDFFEKQRWRIEGVGPIFSYFLKRKKAEKISYTILSSKKINLDEVEIEKLTKSLPALL